MPPSWYCAPNLHYKNGHINNFANNHFDKINVNNIDTIQETINQIKKILNEFSDTSKSIETRIQEFEEFLTKSSRSS